jgi:hypothetical protein
MINRFPSELARGPDSQLFLDGIPEVFDGLAHCAPDAAPGILGLSCDFVCDTLVVQAGIIREVSGRLLDLAFECFALTFEFIAIHKCSSHTSHHSA